ncbi:hypothetical protein HYC85_011016 [Camellia sinensis]|uniref:Carrier domain-containing protein n=1 Tax=Camellia sinensis TaxID=4442 RepID=A0A7J7HJJ8_CAMSI|nr:hypothetical protein HYC85_011016 [Camellia sinensis]
MSPVEIDISLFWCLAAKGEESSECHRFAKYYRSLCLGEWKDLGLDSLDAVEIVKALEEEFKLEILWSEIFWRDAKYGPRIKELTRDLKREKGKIREEPDFRKIEGEIEVLLPSSGGPERELFDIFDCR